MLLLHSSIASMDLLSINYIDYLLSLSISLSYERNDWGLYMLGLRDYFF